MRLIHAALSSTLALLIAVPALSQKKDATRAIGDARTAVASAVELAGQPASELRRRRVKVRAAKGIEAPDLPGPIARGGERDVPPVVAPPKIPPKPGEPDLAYGAYQRGYFLTALDFALPRAEAGDASAQTLIAELYTRGRGVGRDRETARGWYELAAANGDAEAQFAYASLLLTGVRPGEPRPRAAREYMERAARAGHAEAQFNYAQMIVADRPSFAGFKRALPFYRAAAEQGLPDAQYALAVMLTEGNGVPLADPVKARRWMKRAAENGFDTAQVEFGIWLVNGKGGAKDVDAGRAWLERAARDGNVAAGNRLAHIHAQGIGTLVDPVKAGAWHVLTKRAGFLDPEMDRQFAGYSADQQKAALKLVKAWRGRGKTVARPVQTTP